MTENTNQRGTINGFALGAQIAINILGAAMIFQQGANVILLILGIAVVGAIGGHKYPETIDWLWERYVHLFHTD